VYTAHRCGTLPIVLRYPNRDGSRLACRVSHFQSNPSTHPRTRSCSPSACVELGRAISALWRGPGLVGSAYGRRQPSHPSDGSADRRPAAAWPGVGEPVPYLPSYLRWHRWRRRWWSVIRVTTCVTTLQRPERVNIRGVQSTGEIRLQRVLRSETPRKLAPNFLPPFSLFSLPFSSSCFAD
jgi:hypothetical protein